MTQIRSLLLMVLATGLTALVAALADGHVSQPEAINILLAFLGAAVVFTAPNIPGHDYVKWVLAALTAAAMAVASFIGSGGITALTPSEWIQVVIAILGALGVGVFPNTPTPALGRSPIAR